MGEQTAAAWYGESLGPLFVSHGSFAKLLLLDVVCHATNSFNIDPSRHFQRTKNGEVSTFFAKNDLKTALSAIKILLEKIRWKLWPSVLVIFPVWLMKSWFFHWLLEIIFKSPMNLMLKSHHFKAA